MSNTNKVPVIVYTNPVRPEYRDSFYVPVGTSVEDAIASTPTIGTPVVIINGNIEENLDRKLLENDIVAIRFIHTGSAEEISKGSFFAGLGQSLLGIGLMAIPGLQLVGAGLVISGVFTGIVGSIVSNLYGKNETTQAYDISASNNPAAKGRGVPLILGVTKTTPLLLCYATRISGTDGEHKDILLQYIIGAGPLHISDIRLGDVVLSPNASDVQDGEILDIEHFQGVTLEVHQGGTQPTLFPYVIHEESPNVVLYSGEENVRETSPRTNRISVDIVFSGLYRNTTSGPANRSVQVVARYRKKGSATAWASAPLIGYFDDGSNTITRNKTNVIRFNVAKTITSGDAEYATDGIYEVMVERTTADSTDNKVIDIVAWETVRYINTTETIVEQNELDDYDPVLLGLAIEANNTISGAINQLTCLASPEIPVWDGLGSGAAHWASSAISSNPSATLLNLLRGSNNPDPSPDADIYWSSFETFYTYCVTKGFTCKGTINDFQELEAVLQDVAATGRAVVTRRDEKYAIIIDTTKTNVVQLFGPHNSANFTWSQEYPDRPHAYIIEFRDENNKFNIDERVVFDDGYDDTTAERYESISAKYICNSDNVWKHGRYLIACGKLRPARYQFEAPEEAVMCEPGDLIGVVHDAPMFGLADARVVSVTVDDFDNTTSITVNNDFVMEAGKSYQIAIISRNRVLYLKDITTVAGMNRTVTLSTVIPYTDPIYEDDHVFFGLQNSVYVRHIVVGKVHTKDHKFVLYTIDEAPGVHTADSGTIPAWTPQISVPAVVTPQTVIDNSVELPRGPAGDDPYAPIYEYSIDGVSLWHDPWVAGDKYTRISVDNGATWGSAIRIAGEDLDPSDVPGFKGSFLYVSLTEEYYTGILLNDFIVLYSATLSERGVYLWDGDSWVRLSSLSESMINDCGFSVLAAVDAGYGVSTDYLTINSQALDLLIAKRVFAKDVTATNTITGAILQSTDKRLRLSNDGSTDGANEGICAATHDLTGTPTGQKIQISSGGDTLGESLEGIFYKYATGGAWRTRMAMYLNSGQQPVMLDPYYGLYLLYAGSILYLEKISAPGSSSTTSSFWADYIHALSCSLGDAILGTVDATGAITSEVGLNCYLVNDDATPEGTRSASVAAGARSSYFWVYKPITVIFSTSAEPGKLQVYFNSAYHDVAGATCAAGVSKGITLTPGRYAMFNDGENTQTFYLYCIGMYGTEDGTSFWS